MRPPPPARQNVTNAWRFGYKSGAGVTQASSDAGQYRLFRVRGGTVSTAVTVVLADHHRVVCEGLRLLLQREPDLDVVAVADDGPDTIELVGRLKPAVLVMDVVLPSMGGLEVLRRLSAEIPETRVVMLSMRSDDWHVRQALAAGAVGYVAKSADPGELLRAIREAAAGRRHVSVPSGVNVSGPGAHGSMPGQRALTSREREVFLLAAVGRTAQQIAHALGMSPRTAETHRRNLMRKLSLRSQTDLVRYAIRIGAIPPDA
jgi:DNA-binding NarL/FixJ family response regulator